MFCFCFCCCYCCFLFRCLGSFPTEARRLVQHTPTGRAWHSRRCCWRPRADVRPVSEQLSELLLYRGLREYVLMPNAFSCKSAVRGRLQKSTGIHVQDGVSTEHFFICREVHVVPGHFRNSPPWKQGNDRVSLILNASWRLPDLCHIAPPRAVQQRAWGVVDPLKPRVHLADVHFCSSRSIRLTQLCSLINPRLGRVPLPGSDPFIHQFETILAIVGYDYLRATSGFRLHMRSADWRRFSLRLLLTCKDTQSSGNP